MRSAIIILSYLLLTLIKANVAHAEVVDVCYKDGCGPNSSAQFLYTPVQCVSSLVGGIEVYSVQTGSYRSQPSSSHLFQNTPPTFLARCGTGHCGDPAGYGVDPVCEPGEGSEGGECPGGQPRAGQCSGPCSCEAYENQCCGSVPPGCKAELGCPSTGPTATPTPTPTPLPNCTLACPGTPLSQLTGGSVTGPNSDLGGYGGATVLGSSTLLAQTSTGGTTGTGGISLHACGRISDISVKDPDTTTYGFGSISGYLAFEGENSFDCRELYSCPLDPSNPEPCPVPTLSYGGGGGSTTLGAYTGRVLGATSTSSPIKNTPVGKVLGALSDRLLAQKPGTGTGGTGTGSGPYSSTWTQAVTIDRLEGSEPTVYGYTASNAQGQSCKCQVILGCFEAQQHSPNDDNYKTGDCDTSCNLTFETGSEYPTTVDNVIMNIEANDGFEHEVTIDFDNGITQEVIGPFPAQTNNLFQDAGVYDISITCRNPGNNTRTCGRQLSVYCQGSDPESLPTPTPTPPAAWVKLQNVSLHTKSQLSNPAPTGAIAYDETDVFRCSVADPLSKACVISGQAGAVVSKGTANYGAQLSEREWLRSDSNYTINTILDPESFIEYVRARKEVNTMSTVDLSEVELGGINYFQGNVVLVDSDIPDAIPAGQATVIIVDGNLTIDISHGNEDTFNPDNNPIAFIVTGEFGISAATVELNGIYIANTVDYAYDAFPITTTPLKINGNISSMQLSPLCNTQRQRDDNEQQPSCFVQLDIANQFLPFWDLLSTRTYEWSELAP